MTQLVVAIPVVAEVQSEVPQETRPIWRCFASKLVLDYGVILRRHYILSLTLCIWAGHIETGAPASSSLVCIGVRQALRTRQKHIKAGPENDNEWLVGFWKWLKRSNSSSHWQCLDCNWSCVPFKRGRNAPSTEVRSPYKWLHFKQPSCGLTHSVVLREAFM